MITSASAVRVSVDEACAAVELDEVLRARQAGLGRGRLDGAAARRVGRDREVGLGEQPEHVAVLVVGGADAGAFHAGRA